MKLVVLLLAIILASSLSVHPTHEEPQLSHESSETENHEMTATEESHEPTVDHDFGALAAVDTAVGVAEAAMKLGELLADAFKVTCSESGYKRGNNINIFNDVKGLTMNYKGTFQDSGKLYNNFIGKRTLNFGQDAKWKFVKHSGSSTGSCGVLIYSLSSGSDLVVYYENPWSGWNFAGICVWPNIPKYPSDKFMKKSLYNVLYDGHPKWPRNCLLVDNTESKQVLFYRDDSLKAGGFNIGLNLRYELFDGEGTNDCYTQELDIVVRKA